MFRKLVLIRAWDNKFKLTPTCMCLVGKWVSVSEWVSERGSQWVSERASGWVSEWVRKRVSEWVSKWVSVWVSRWVDRGWVTEGVLSAWVCVCMHARVEWVHVRVNVTEWVGHHIIPINLLFVWRSFCKILNFLLCLPLRPVWSY